MSFVMIVRLSVFCMEEFVSHWTDFCEVLYCGFSLRSVDQIQFWLKSDKDNIYLYELHPVVIYI